MKFLEGLFNKAEKPFATPNTIDRATFGGGSTGWAGIGNSHTESAWDLDRSLSRGFDRVVWVFRCVHVIASKQASLTMQLKDTTKAEGEIVSDREFYKLLNRKANPYESAWKFRYRLSAQLLLSPLGAFVEVVRAKSGKIVELYLLPPGSVEPIKDRHKWVSGYKVKRSEGQFDVLDPDDVIWVMNIPHPTDPYRNVTPLESCGIAAETDYFARLYNKNFIGNDGRPGMLIGIDADLTSDDAAELKRLLNGGVSRVGETRVIDSKGLSVVDLTVRPRDSQWNELTKDAREVVLAAFGVPASVIFSAAGRCLRASESVFLANGEIKAAEELVGQKFTLLQPRKGQIVEVNAKADYAKSEMIYRITTFSGRTLETNAEHPLFMATSANQGPFKRDIFPHGWTEMKAIKAQFDRNDLHNVSVGDGGVHTEVAVPVDFPVNNPVDRDPDECWAIGEDGQTIPDFMFNADIESQRAFLSGLYTHFGRLSQHTSFDLYPPNLNYARRLQRLLQRVGVYAAVTTKKMRHMVSVSGKINMFNFLSQLELDGAAAERAKTVWSRLQSDSTREQNFFRTDGLPPGMVWDRIYSVEQIGVDQTVAITVPEGDHTYLSLFWEHNTFDNAEVEQEEFWTGTMMPHCEAIARDFEPLTDDIDDNIFVSYNYEEVDILQKMLRRKEDKYKQEFLTGAITLDAMRVALGEPPLDLPHTRVLYLNNGVIVGTPEDVEVVRQSQLNPQQLQAAGGVFPGADAVQNPFTAGTTGGNGAVGGANDMVQGELAAAGSPQATQTINDQAARTLRSASQNGRPPLAINPNANTNVYERIDSMTNRKYVRAVNQIDTKSDVHRDTRANIRGFLEGTIDSWSDRQLSIARDRLTHTKVRKGTRHWEGEVGEKVLDAGYVVDTTEWVSEIRNGTADYLRSALVKAAYAEANRLKDSGYQAKGQFFNELVVVELAEMAANLIAESAENQTALATKHIGVLDADNKSIAQIQATMTSSAFDRDRWAVALAKKATVRALESLYDHIYSNVEGRAYKVWNVGTDELLREGHAELDGKMIKSTVKFDLNGEQLRFPTDTIGEEADNCTCWLYYGVDV